MVKNSRDIQLSELKDTIVQLNNTIRTLNDTIARQQAENADLKAELAWFRKKMFGSSSEHRTADLDGQLSLFDISSEEETPTELIEPEIVEKSVRSRRKKTALKEQFKDIPTRQVFVDTLTDEDKVCPLCGSEMLAIGTELIRSEIVYTPPKLERIEYIATTYACPTCKDTEEPQFIKDNGKPALIPGSYVSESLLSYIVSA